jgi:hypothetical protein
MQKIIRPSLGVILRATFLIGCSCAIFMQESSAAICVSIADGEFSSPDNWSCGCNPASCDTLVITHHMTATGSVGLAQGGLEIDASGSLDVIGDFRLLPGFKRALFLGNLTARTVELNAQDSVVSYGTMLCDSIWIRLARYVNYGELEATDFFGAVGFPGMQPIYNAGSIRTGLCVSGHQILNEGQWVSDRASLNWYISEGGSATFEDCSVHVFSELGQGATLVVSDTLRIQQDLESFGLLHCGTFINGAILGTALTRLYLGSELVCGNFVNQSNGFLYGPGSLCIAGHSENHGVISAPINICDITLASDAPPPYLDVNTGGFLLPIYRCAVGSCATVGMREPAAREALTLRPNPAEDWVDIAVHPSASVVVLLDGLGRTVLNRAGPFTSVIRLSRNGLVDGCYMVIVIDEVGQVISRERLFFIKN